ncbi:EH domain-containing protein 4 [Grus japonensis]|uniref:EH domain-containing protein 4 n=1 Tax=Grus japonensis TaxID=30415 RepID=A0ABC9YL40_GRUJA
MVKQAVHLQPMEDPTPEQVEAPEGGCDPMGSLHWSKLLAGPVDPWREELMLEQVCWQDLGPHGGPMLEQFMKNCSLWEGLMLEKFMKDCLLWEGLHVGAGE